MQVVPIIHHDPKGILHAPVTGVCPAKILMDNQEIRLKFLHYEQNNN